MLPQMPAEIGVRKRRLDKIPPLEVPHERLQCGKRRLAQGCYPAQPDSLGVLPKAKLHGIKLQAKRQSLLSAVRVLASPTSASAATAASRRAASSVKATPAIPQAFRLTVRTAIQTPAIAMMSGLAVGNQPVFCFITESSPFVPQEPFLPPRSV
jgi:hypothetical protein